MATFTLKLSRPSERQKLFLQAKKKYIAFGGARGGGKSWAVRTKAVLLALRYPGIKIMLIRKTYPELRANHIEPLIALLGRTIATYNDGKKEYKFRNGSAIVFRYCATESDLEKYQGTEADVIFIDEATQHNEKDFRVFAACLRGVNNYPKRIYLTCNPGGRGHGWVRRLFVDRAFNDDENPSEYEFIQSLVYDNQALLKAQPDYIKQLENLPPRLRDMWLHGKWDVFEGQFFAEFRDDPAKYLERAYTHVITPFKIPSSWKRYRSFDWGYNKPFSVGWWVLSHDNVLYRVLELYGCVKNAPDEGIRWTPEQVFGEIARIESEHEYLKGHQVFGIADPAIWDKQRGKSIADTAADFGVYFDKGDNKRIPGWMQMRYRLAFDENGHPMLYVFYNCSAFIRTIPQLVFSELKPEDLDTTQEDHVADECRYLCMSNPIAPRIAAPKPEIPADDPLDLYKDRQPEYRFFNI